MALQVMSLYEIIISMALFHIIMYFLLHEYDLLKVQYIVTGKCTGNPMYKVMIKYNTIMQ